MKTLNDYQKAKHTYFRLISSYEWGVGWTNIEDAKRLHVDVPALFVQYGWEITDAGNDSGTYPTVSKGISSLYLHPMNFSGPCADDLIPEVKEIIGQVDCVTLTGVDQYRYIYKVDDEYNEMHLYHLIHDYHVVDIFAEALTTKRKDYYKNKYSVVCYLRDKLDIKTSLRYIGYTSGDTCFKYIDSYLDMLISSGWVVTSGGDLMRWANKKEQKNLKPISI